jgi:hypothetical protein
MTVDNSLYCRSLWLVTGTYSLPSPVIFTAAGDWSSDGEHLISLSQGLSLTSACIRPFIRATADQERAGHKQSLQEWIYIPWTLGIMT